MSRTGVEAKPPWKRLPKTVRQQVDSALGAPVVQAVRIWGGYTPTPTYRLVVVNWAKCGRFLRGNVGNRRQS